MFASLTYPLFQAFDDAGAPLTGGLLYTYEAGTTTAKATYSEYTLVTANANPVVLDSRGEAIVYGSGSYKFVLKTALGVTVWTQDNLSTGTLTSAVLNVGVSGTAVLDEDTMVSNSATKIATQQSIKAYIDNICRQSIVRSRPKFTYNGGSTALTITVGPAGIWCKDKFAWWDVTLTTNALTGAVASTWYYLYLDYSAITSWSEITATELIWSATAPTWSDTYKSYMNGDDVCIFACRTNAAATNFLEFFHDGSDLVTWADYIVTNSNITAITTAWADALAFIAPSFSTRALVTFLITYVSAAATVYWRTNGQTGTAGHYAGTAREAGDSQMNQCIVVTDANHIIEWYESANTTNQNSINEDGWYFPVGM